MRTDPAKLSIILEPLSWQLDACWWHLNGNGANLSDDDYDDYERFTERGVNYQVGRPGWFRRFIDKSSTDWAVYVACESANDELPRLTLDRVDSSLSNKADWFGDAGSWSLPSDVLFLCRDVDDAWWDLFFRDEYMAQVTVNHLRRHPGISWQWFEAPEAT